VVTRRREPLVRSGLRSIPLSASSRYHPDLRPASRVFRAGPSGPPLLASGLLLPRQEALPPRSRVFKGTAFDGTSIAVTGADRVYVTKSALAAMRRILMLLASAIGIAVLIVGFLYRSDLLRLNEWSQVAVGIGLFAMGGSVAGDIWWREVRALRASRRGQSRKLSTLGIRLTKLEARVRSRVRAPRRSWHVSNEVVGGFVLSVLLLLLIGLFLYYSDEFVRLLSDPEF